MNNKYMELPDYYPTMHLDGYTPEEIFNSHHKTMLKNLKSDSSDNIKIESEIKIK